MMLWKRFAELSVTNILRVASMVVTSLRGDAVQVNMRELSRLGKRPAPAAKTSSTTLTASELLGGLITGTPGGSAAATYTLPTVASLEDEWKSQYPGLAADDSFEFVVMNLSTVAAEDITIATNTGWTLVGNMVVESNEGTAQKGPTGTFVVRRVSPTAYTLYRVAG